MLILTRHISETIKIGDDINITVLGIKGSQVCIGIDAPREVDVHREEIYHKIKSQGSLKERMKAQGLPVDDLEDDGDEQL